VPLEGLESPTRGLGIPAVAFVKPRRRSVFGLNPPNLLC
jgi:hypothetical protein